MPRLHYEDIVKVEEIATPNNSVDLNDVLRFAKHEKFKPASYDGLRTAVVAIDFNRDFLPGGSLAVPGADQDIARATRWMYNNMRDITKIFCSIDIHSPMSIFFPIWWHDEYYDQPSYFTRITLEDVVDQRWIPSYDAEQTVEYLRKAKYIDIWPYHCLAGTSGCALDNQFNNMINYISLAKESPVKYVMKGTERITEMYGIFKSVDGSVYNALLFDNLKNYDRIVFMGEAKSHCVLTSIQQFIDIGLLNEELHRKIYILTDCMSSIPGCEKETEEAYEKFTRFGAHLVTTDTFSLE
jgi:nicotinamidase-related amidase